MANTIPTFSSWSDLLGASRTLSDLAEDTAPDSFPGVVRRLRRFHSAVKEHANWYAPALAVNDGVAQVTDRLVTVRTARAPKTQDVSEHFFRTCALVHYAAAVEDLMASHPGVATTICDGKRVRIGDEYAGSYGSLKFHATSPEPEDMESDAWVDWWAENKNRLGPNHFVALELFQLNTAFGKAWETNGILSSRRDLVDRARLFVERSVIQAGLDRPSLERFDAGEIVAFRYGEDLHALLVFGVDWDIQRVDEDQSVSTKSGVAIMSPCRVRFYRQRKLRLRTWRVLEADVKEEPDLFLEDGREPTWR